MNSSRLLEYYRRVLREDMLARFSRVVELMSLEICIVLESATAVQQEIKYKSACLLELLTGRRPEVFACDVTKEGIFSMNSAESGSKGPTNAHKLKQAMMLQHRGTAPTADDYRKAATSASGLRMSSIVTREEDMFLFIEKLREFYLPDVLAMDDEMPLSQRLQQAKARKDIASYFRIPSHTGKGQKSSPILATDNPETALTTFQLKSTDFLRFPDVELFFEPFSSVLGGAGHSAHESTLPVYIRPTLHICKPPIEPDDALPEPEVDHLKIMNYFLGRLFNPFVPRARTGVKPPIAPPPPEHLGHLPPRAEK